MFSGGIERKHWAEIGWPNVASNFIADSLILTLSAPIPQNGQTHSSKSSAIAGELFGCVWPFNDVGALRLMKG